MRRTALAAGVAALAILLGACGSNAPVKAGSAAAKASGSTGITVKDAWVRAAPDMGSMMSGSGSGSTMGGGMMGGGGMMSRPGGTATTTAASSDSDGAAFFTIVNNGTKADALIGVMADVSDSSELHAANISGGSMHMRKVKRVEIPAGTSVRFKEDGYHVMMIGLKRSLDPGSKVKLTLTFEKAGVVSVEAPVREE